MLLYPDGTCLDCQPIGARDAAFTADPALYTAVSGGSLIRYGFDGIEYDNLLESGITDPVWSSRGQLALVRGSSVWVGGLNGVRRLGPGSAPSWSPDGRRVVLVRRGWITIVRPADRAATRLVRGSSPAWSPDGRLIAFFDRTGRVRVIGVSGGADHPVGNIRGRSIDWQPLPAHVALRCLAPPGSEVMAESLQAIVYEDGSTVPFQLNPPTAFTGCLKATGRERVLPVNTFQSEDEEMGATGAATAGQYAALATFDTDIHYGGSTDTLVVYNLQTGNSIPNLGGETVSCGGYSCTTTMDNIGINQQGFTAVHTTMSSYCGSYSDICQETIQAADSGGQRTLDTAAPASSNNPILTDLTLSGDTLTWKHGGTPESDELH